MTFRSKSFKSYKESSNAQKAQNSDEALDKSFADKNFVKKAKKAEHSQAESSSVEFEKLSRGDHLIDEASSISFALADGNESSQIES